jgi:hypothetical protein
MYEIIQKAHSGWAYIVLLLLLLSALNSMYGFFSQKQFEKKDRTIALLALIAVHIQFLIGLVTYFVSPLGKSALGEMKNPTLRLTSLEHPLINIIAIILITIGWSLHKKKLLAADKFRSLMVFYSIGLALILTRIPWHLWFPN